MLERTHVPRHLCFTRFILYLNSQPTSISPVIWSRWLNPHSGQKTHFPFLIWKLKNLSHLKVKNTNKTKRFSFYVWEPKIHRCQISSFQTPPQHHLQNFRMYFPDLDHSVPVDIFCTAIFNCHSINHQHHILPFVLHQHCQQFFSLSSTSMCVCMTHWYLNPFQKSFIELTKKFPARHVWIFNPPTNHPDLTSSELLELFTILLQESS